MFALGDTIISHVFSDDNLYGETYFEIETIIIIRQMENQRSLRKSLNLRRFPQNRRETFVNLAENFVVTY